MLIAYCVVTFYTVCFTALFKVQHSPLYIYYVLLVGVRQQSQSGERSKMLAENPLKIVTN